MEYIIRPMRKEEYPLLKDFLYMALYVPEGCQPKPRSILSIPELKLYYEDFGSSPDDISFAAESNGEVIGCVWTRIMNDFSHQDDKTPSLVVAVREGFRGQGLGTRLIRHMLAHLAGLHREAVSLSVQKSHPAQFLYTRLGFEEVGRAMGETEEEIVMVLKLAGRDWKGEEEQ